MTTHELAKKLLEGPDLPVTHVFDGQICEPEIVLTYFKKDEIGIFCDLKISDLRPST